VPGALIGGGLAAYFYTRRSKLSFAKWADLIAPGVALGQAIGRLGNFVNQELYGRPTDLPWAIAISPENRVPGYEQFSRFHPMFLYEMIVNLLICIGLIGIDSRFGRRLRSGDLLAIYAVLYGCGRFFLEFLKLDAPAFGQGLTIAQLLSLITVAAGLLFIWLRHRRWAGHSAEEPSS
jgi:phosphatidylglycerol:prolipoprotein diacylglycerol transferase